MDARGAAQYLKLDEKTITRWARKAYLPAHPLGEGKRKFWRFYEHELSAWISGQSNGASVQPSESPPPPVQLADECADIVRPGGPTPVRRMDGSRPRQGRYQRGSLSLLKHKKGPATWTFRYYTHENGRRSYKRKSVGSLVEFPTRKDAERAIAQFRVVINERPGSLAQQGFAVVN